MANPYNTKPSADIFKSLIIQMASSIVWKNSSLANEYDLGTNLYQSEMFMAAKRGLLNFTIIRAFDEQIISALGYSGPVANRMVANKLNIPEGDRARAVQLYKEKITAKDLSTGRYINYIEKNDYYRMLTGLPPLNETSEDFVYITEFNTQWPMDIPVHEMTLSQRLELEKSGYLNKLIAANPKKDYLRYIGKKSIDIFAARAADRFEILYNESDNATFGQDFRELYNQNRYVVNAVYYSPAFKKSNALYENFLAMSILFMTIEQITHRYLLKDITRDFYDVESIKYIYDSYGVPFYPEIPLEYHTRIAKEINRLISYKGSSQVFYDLFNLFDSSAMRIYSYYICKNRVFMNGKPIFPKKEDGTLDEKAAYNITFSKVLLGSDPALETSDPSNRLAFPDLTYDDPYWVNDDDLMKTIYSSDFNYTESKYLGLQTVLDVLGTTYHNAYFFKMLQDNKAKLQNVNLKWTVTGSYIPLFDFFIYMASLYCKKFGYSGELSDNPAFTATVLGYDFKNHVIHLKELILKDPILKTDEKLVNLIRNMDCSDLASVNRTFESITNLRTLLVQKFSDTHDKHEFETYRNLYDTLLTSENIRSSFTKSDGTMATSYDDMLADVNPTLYERLITTSLDDIDNEIRIVINEVEQAIPSVKNLDSAFDLDVNALIESIFKILQFFKSAKAELVGYNIVYVMSIRGVNFFKLMDQLMSAETWSQFGHDDIILSDIMEIMRDELDHINDMISMLKDEPGELHEHSRIYDYIHTLCDDLRWHCFLVENAFHDEIHITDFLMSQVTEMALYSIMKWSDNGFLIREEFLEAKYRGMIKDVIHWLTDDLQEIKPDGYIDGNFRDNTYLIDFVEKVEQSIPSYYNLMNRESFFRKDEIEHLLSIILFDDKSLNLLCRNYMNMITCRIGMSAMGWADKFIFHILPLLDDIPGLQFADDVLSAIIEKDEFLMSRIRIKDEFQGLMTRGAEILRSILGKWRDHLRIREESSVRETRFPIDDFIVGETDSAKYLAYDLFTILDQLLSGSSEVEEVLSKSNFKFELTDINTHHLIYIPSTDNRISFAEYIHMVYELHNPSRSMTNMYFSDRLIELYTEKLNYWD